MSSGFLLAIAIVIVAGLSAYALVLIRQVKAMQARQAEALEEQRQKQLAQRRYMVESIQVIARNVIHEDLNLSEATIRCKVLLDGLLLSEEQRAPFNVIEEVFEQVQQFDTHDARKRLDKNERRQQDRDREMIESRYQDALTDCFQQLQTFDPDRV